MQEAHLQLDQVQKLVGKLRVKKSIHEETVTKLKQRIYALEGKVSMHPAQSNETTQAEPSAAEHPSDEDVILNVAGQNGYESDTESEDNDNPMPIDRDDIPSTTNSRPAHYKGKQRTVSNFTDERPYHAGKQKENLPNPSMPVDYQKEMQSLLGTKKDREFPNIVSERPELLAMPQDVFNFCFNDDAPGPNLQHPQIHIEAPENIWNVSLAWQFADMVMQKYPEKDLSTDIVA
ncbi:hypothetical protein C0989_011829 [Termitomyces sp. Mn162]|nr:hypothetical protein C0989_011829 [Termitomyces sp. Mn162]